MDVTDVAFILVLKKRLGNDRQKRRRVRDMKFRKKSIVIEATQWFKNGDHPEDACAPIQPSVGDTEIFMSEGKVVRYFRHPQVSGESKCPHCCVRFHEHGWIDTLEGGHTVCPGDWIITGIKGERYPCKPDIFEATYDLVDDGEMA